MDVDALGIVQQSGEHGDCAGDAIDGGESGSEESDGGESDGGEHDGGECDGCESGGCDSGGSAPAAGARVKTMVGLRGKRLSMRTARPGGLLRLAAAIATVGGGGETRVPRVELEVFAYIFSYRATGCPSLMKSSRATTIMSSSPASCVARRTSATRAHGAHQRCVCGAGCKRPRVARRVAGPPRLNRSVRARSTAA
jgi:hypothetical protein